MKNKYYIVPTFKDNYKNDNFLRFAIQTIGFFQPKGKSKEKPIKRGLQFIVKKSENTLTINEIKNVYKHINFSINNLKVRALSEELYDKTKKVTYNINTIVKIIMDELDNPKYKGIRISINHNLFNLSYLNGLFRSSYYGLIELRDEVGLRELINKDIKFDELDELINNLENLDHML